MKGYRKILTLILFALVSLSGAFFGCRGRYDGVKITSDKSETGLKLYLGEEIEDGNNLSVGTITFTISGASENAASKMKYSFEGNEESKIVKITKIQIQANSATLTLQAISGGSTKLVAMSEEGNKTCGVKIECIKEVKAMSFNSTYSPAMFNIAGSQLTINTKKIDFVPADTTQNQVTYSLKNDIDGVSITPAGIITLEKQVAANDFVVVATSIANSSLSSEISVHLVKPLSSEDGSGITIFCESDLYEDDKINLTTVGEESSVIIRADVDTTERITLGYKIDRNNGSVDCINVEHSGYEFGIYANNIGTCKLIIQVYFDDYPELEVAEKEIEVNVVELPTTITVNGISQDFANDIYTFYQNGLGQEYLIKIGDYFAYDKSFVLASDEEDNFEIRKSDGTLVKFGTVDDEGVVGGDFDVLQSNSSIFVKGLSPNVNANLYIYAHGTLGKRIQLVRKISLRTLLGSENLEPEYRTLNGEDTNIFYVELGKSFELGYKIDHDTSAKNIKLLNADGSEIDDYISLDITNSTTPTITVTGIKPGSLSCKLMLENLVESETFLIYVFVPVNYYNADSLDGGVYFKVDSPLANRNIAEAVYTGYGNYSSVSKMVISLGATVQLYSSNDPTNATIIDTRYSTVLLQNGEVVEDSDASEYVAAYSSGYVVAKRVLPDTIIVDGEEVSQAVALKIEISSLVTNEAGDPETRTSIKYILVEGYVPLREVTISKKNTTIYWNSVDLLNPVQRNAGAYRDSLSLALYPNSISGSKVRIDWDYPSELTLMLSDNDTTATIMAIANRNDVRDLSVYTVTATIQYYTTTIVRRCIVNVIKATKAKTLIAYVQDNALRNNNVAYFEFAGANQISPENKQIIAEVYSENNVKDVTFDKIYFKSLDTSVAVVDENGLITPVGAGRTYIHVYAEDMMTSVDDYAEYKVIEVVVADGSSKEAAFRISTEADFDKLVNGPDYFYYLANDITFTHAHFVPVFNGNFDGNNHYINGIVLNEIEDVVDNENNKYISLFGAIGNDAVIENLNLTLSLNYNITDKNIYIAGVTINNNGKIRDVSVYYLNANITVQAEKEVYFAGAVINNSGRLTNVSVSANVNIDVAEDQDYTLGKLYVGGIVEYNDGYIYGQNDNYKPVSLNAIQEYDFAGKIKVSNRIFATESAIGGIAACNNQTIGSTSIESGLAVDVTIESENIDNVGGLAGINLGNIQDALANVDIFAHDNVGGAVGTVGKERGADVVGSGLVATTITSNSYSKASLTNVIVEMYDNIDGVNFGKVQGNSNVGGLVGSTYGYFTISKTSTIYVENEVEVEEFYNDLMLYSAYLSRSYVYAYSNQSGIFGQNNVGGLAGNARLTTIEKCYANTKLFVGNFVLVETPSAENLGNYYEKQNNNYLKTNDISIVDGKLYYLLYSEDKIVGGLVGNAQHVMVSKAYSIVSCQVQDDAIFGSALGKTSKYVRISAFYSEKSSIDEFYSTNQGEFVGEGTEFEIGTKGAYKQDLQDINTFVGWNIGDEISYSTYYNWLILPEENNGYPTLMFDSLNLMRKLQPTQLFIENLDYEESSIISDELIVLNTEKVHRLSDVLRVYTDVSTRATIYAYSDKEGVLNTRNTTNKLSNNTSLQSNAEQVVTLTFVLGNNISVTKSVQIAFVNLAKEYSVNNLKIKKNHSQNIAAKVSFDINQLPEALNSENYKLGILTSDITDLDGDQVVQISNSEIVTIDEKEYLLCKSGSAVLAVKNANLSSVPVVLFYELNYTDLNGNPQKQYISVLSSKKIDVNIYSGASSIYASTTNIDMTIIDEVTFTISVSTDDETAKLFIDPASENIYCNQNNLSDYVVLASNATVGTESSAKVELYVLGINDKIRENNVLEVTFALRFLDKYFETEKFNKEFSSKMEFWAEREGQDDVVSTEVNIKAMPQWLLKIDISNYPAGKNERGSYVPVSVPANTLTPGQVGLMVIDIYPEYAYYDQIEVVSSEDAEGNHISFIQVAQNVGSGNEYIELKPNTNIIEKGLVLMPYSTISFNEDKTNYTTAFDGKFYIKTLMGTNVSNQEEITITVTGLTYQVDENGNYVLDENGNYIVSRQLIKTLVVVVNPAPEVAVSVNDKIYTSPVYVKNIVDNKVNYQLAGNYNLTLANTTVNMQIELKNGLVATRSEVYYKVYNKIDIGSNGEAQDGTELRDITLALSAVQSDLSFSICFNDEKLRTGNIIEVWVETFKTINGFTEKYTSNKQKFLIVDKILTGLNISGSKTSINFTVNEPRNLTANLEYATLNTNSSSNSQPDNKDLNDNGLYWSGYNSRDNLYYDWGYLTTQEEELFEEFKNVDKNNQIYDYTTPTTSFENYIAYKTVDEYKRAKDNQGNFILDNDGNYTYELNKEGSFGITATNNSVGISKFKVNLYYYYIQENVDDTTVCTLQISPNLKESEGIQADYAMNLVTEIDMNITVATTLDEPLTVYTIDDFYSMVPGNDYILMNDLYFGNIPEDVITATNNENDRETEIAETKTWARTYTPFEFDASSFDGNMHTIHFYGNYFNTTYDSAGREISSYVNSKDETIANIGLFTSINADSIVKDVDIRYHAMQNEDPDKKLAINIDQDTTMTANTINFGGLTVTNNGVVSNVFVYIEGDVNIDTNSVEGQVNIAGFVYQNSGKITYSSVYGTDWNDNDFSNNVLDKHNIKFKSQRAGTFATFACTNSYLISNCETECIGIENTTPASRNARIAGFVVNNSGRIYNSSSAGQVLLYSTDSAEIERIYNHNIIIEDDYEFATAIGANDKRIVGEEKNKYFAGLSSNGNIAGFVYQNSGEIENAYSSYPMLTGARTAGFVFDNSNAGSVITSYTACYYDGTNTNNSAYAPFVGTNELGEVLNDPQTSVVKYSYYILDEHEVYEEDVTFKEPASRISLSEGDSDSVSNQNSFVGFDKGKQTSIWNVTTSKYMLPTLTSNAENKSTIMREGFIRTYTQEQREGYVVIKFARVSRDENPYQIADAYQFVKVFNDEAVWFKDGNGTKVSGYLNHSIRLINDIDLSEYAGTELLNNIRKVVYMGDFDGNGMIISGIDLVGSEEFVEDVNPVEKNIYSNVSSSYGLFNQIGTATVTNYNQNTRELEFYKNSFSTKQEKNNLQVNNTRIRNMILKVDNVSKSTSAFTGILAGVILNTDVQSVKIQSNNVSVLGKNVVGGLAGGVFGDSLLYNVTVNANVTSSYQSKANNLYKDDLEVDGLFSVEYKSIDYSTEHIPLNQNFGDYRDNYKDSTISIDNYGFVDKNGEFVDENGIFVKIDLASRVSACSYAGGVVGIADIYDESASLVDGKPYEHDYLNDSSKIGNRTPNLELLTVYGDVTISAEVVGGIVGGMSEDTYLGNISFVVSNDDSQRLAGLFTSGGIAGINNGGVIQFSNVELAQAYVDSNDTALTNQTGNNLFNGLNVYPYAVGGLVGIERGGYLLTDYSKANVISPNAKYVGGIVGYLTGYSSIFKNGKVVIDNTTYRLSDLKYGRYVLMEEVYTTGNVFAGDAYSWDWDSVLDENGNKKYICTPTSYAGGIVGYYKFTEFAETKPYNNPTSLAKQANYDTFNSVIGINAFHIPANYTYSTNYTLVEGGTAKYSNLMYGFEGKRELSSGNIQYAKFLPRLGSIFGYVECDTDESNFKYYSQYLSGSRKLYYNLYTDFVYNTNTLTESICKNKNSGCIINYVAADNKSGVINGIIADPDAYVDIFTYATGSSDSQIKTVDLNHTELENLDEFKLIEPNLAYLVLRAFTNYREYQSNENGIYSGWDNNWIFNSPVYPKFKPKDWNDFISIETESQLREIRSGNRYKIVKDIYLTSNWSPKSLNHVTLVSEKRDDGQGIILNGISNQYYVIYNVNILGNGNQSSYGFFSELRYSKVRNVNFVYGTNITDPEEPTKYYGNALDDENLKINTIGRFGFEYDGTASNVGLFAGSISRTTSIENCNVYVNNDLSQINTERFRAPQDGEVPDPEINYTIKLTKEGDIENTKNVGGMVGNAKDGSYVSGRIVFGGIQRNGTQTQFNLEDLDSNDSNLIVTNSSPISTFNLGGFVGCLDAAQLQGNYVNSLALEFRNESSIEKANIGGYLGLFTSGPNITSVFHVEATVSAKIIVEGVGSDAQFTSLAVGGAFGKIESSVEVDRRATLNVNIPSIYINHITNTLSDVTDADKISEQMEMQGLYVGGVAGYLNSSNILSRSPVINIGDIEIDDIELARSYVGGLIGCVYGKSKVVNIYTSTDQQTSIKYGKIYAEVNIGGAFGYVSNQITIDNVTAYFDSISFSGNAGFLTFGTGTNAQKITPTLNVGGFIGEASYSSNNNNDFIGGSYAKGEINFSNNTNIDTAFNFICGGFIANGAATNSIQTSYNMLTISTSISDVEIKLGRMFENAKVAGFAATGIGVFSGCISLGDIVVSRVVSAKGAMIAGFAAYDLTDNKLGTNYSLSTIKAIATDYTKIAATSRNYNNKILYNYNLSGVFSEQGKKVNLSTTPDNKRTGERTYTSLSADLRNKLVSNSNTILRDNISKYIIVNENTGSKVQPKNMSDALISGSYGNFKNNEYFVITGNYPIQTYSINANLIGDNKDEAYTLTFSVWTDKTTEICANNMLSGVAITSTKHVIIQKNSGYIFNCVSVGKLEREGLLTEKKIVGFVDQNNGKINACGSNAYLDAKHNERVDVVGFVYHNKGQITNSYAANIFLNTVAQTDISNGYEAYYNVGFVFRNYIGSTKGYIYNCYSSPSIFDLIDEDGNVLSRKDDLLGKDAANTFPFAFDGMDPYYCDNYTAYYNSVYIGNNASADYSKYKQGAKNTLFGESVTIENKEDINYGLTTPLSYNTVLNEDFTLGSLNTGDGSAVNYIPKPFKINNIIRFSYVGKNNNSNISTNHYIRLVNNIDAFRLYAPNNSFYSTVFYATGTIINVNNLELFTIYNLTNYELFRYTKSAVKLTVKNFGVVADIYNASTPNDPYVVGWSSGILTKEVSNLTADNCYVSLQHLTTFAADDGNNESYYGLFVGKVNSKVDLNGCFASGDVKIGCCDINNIKVHVGTLIGKISNGTINNCFASGTTTITNQNSTATLYVGGLVGSSENVGFEHCYSNVSLKNQISNKYYKNAYVGAFGGNGGSWSGYQIQRDLNYIDKNISLTDKVFGYEDETTDESLFSHITLLTSPVFSGEYVNTVTENHLPIQKAFKDDIIVYYILNINELRQTGSKMAPKNLNNSSLQSNYYYYLSENRSSFYNSSLQNFTIIGNDYGFVKSSVGGYWFNNENLSQLRNVTMSGFTVKNYLFLRYVSDSYVYSVKIATDSDSGVSIPDKGIIYSTKNTVYDSCSVNGYYKPFEQTGDALSAFIYQSNGDTIKNIDINVDMFNKGSDTNKYWYDDLAGVVSKLGSNVTSVLGSIKINLRANMYLANTLYGVCVGGIIPYIQSTSKINIFANIDEDITINRNCVSDKYYIGGVIGKIGSNARIFSPQLDIKITEAVINSDDLSNNDGQYSDCYASPVIAKCAANDDAVISNITIDCSPYISISATHQIGSYPDIYVGGIAAELTSGKICDINVGNQDNSFKVYTQWGISRIGGIVGSMTGGTIGNCKANYDLNVTNGNKENNCYAGGVVGYLGGGTLSSSTSNGLVAGLTYATESVKQLTVEDARVFEEKNIPKIGKFLSNYGKNTINIPLVVGGIIGYYNEGTLSNVNKTTGDVRALIYTYDSIDDDNINMSVKDTFITKLISGLPSTDNQKVNSEYCQARVGALCGLMSSSVVTDNDYFTQVGSAKHIFANHDNGGRMIRLTGQGGVDYGRFLRYGVNNNTAYGAKAGYYTLSGFNTSNIYYDFGNMDPNSDYLADCVSGTNDGDAKFNNFNYIQWNRSYYDKGDRYWSKTQLSYSAFDDTNIFYNDIQNSDDDWFLKYDERYNAKEYYDSNLSNSDYADKTGNYMVYIDYENTGDADLNGMHLHAKNLPNIAQNNEASKVKVFAGFRCYYYNGVYMTYNRSFWYVASDLLSRDGEDHFGTDKANMYKTSLYFYPTQHWAGTVVGGVIINED